MKRSAILAVLVAIFATRADAAPTLQWETRAAPGLKRTGGAVAATVNDKIYIFGGNGPEAGTGTEIYDPATDKWSRGAKMPTRRESPCVAVVDGKIYLIGGTDPEVAQGDYHKGQLTKVEMYDPATNTWTTKASMNQKRDVAAVGVIDGKIYSLGGMYGELNLPQPENLDNVEVYDPQLNQWTLLPSKMPTPMRAMAYATIGARIFLFGGCAGRSESPCTRTDVMAYDTPTDTWITYEVPLPVGRHFSGQGAVTVGEKALVFGGATDFSKQVFGNVELFDEATQTWEELTPMKTPRKSSASVVVNGYLYIIGGHRDDTYSTGGDVNERARISDLITFGASAVPSGEASALTLDVSLSVGAADVGRDGQIFVLARKGSQWHSLTASGWVPYGGGELPAYSSGTLPSTTTIRITSSGDVRPYRGTDIYVAYGFSQADMLERRLYRLVHTF